MRLAEGRALQLAEHLGINDPDKSLFVSSVVDHASLLTYHNNMFIAVSFYSDNVCIEVTNECDQVRDIILGFNWTGKLSHTTEMI